LTDLPIRERGPISGNSQYADPVLQTGGIDVDQDDYSPTPDSTPLDRVYNIKGLNNMHVEIKNTGIVNGLTYRIESARKEFKLITELIDGDFDNEILANTNVGPTVNATGTITIATPVANTFADGDIVIASPVANTFADGDIVCASVQVGDTVTVNGLVYTAISGSKAGDNTKFDQAGTDDQCATDLADSIDNDTRSGTTGDLSATASTDTVTAVTDVLGAAGNAITLVSSNGTRLAVTGSGFFTGGVTADTVTVNGLVYTAVAGAKANDTEFSIDSTNAATATDLADSIDDDTRVGTLGDQSATATTVTVTVVTDVLGTGGNAITLVSSDGTRLAVTGSGFFTGGVTADTVTVNGLLYTAVAGAKANDTEFSIDSTNDATATDLADSIDDDVRVGTLGDVTAIAVTNVVTCTSNQLGALGNPTTLASSDGTRLAVSAATFTGGVDTKNVKDTVNISPALTAIRIKVKRQVAGDSTTMSGIVSVN